MTNYTGIDPTADGHMVCNEYYKDGSLCANGAEIFTNKEEAVETACMYDSNHKGYSWVSYYVPIQKIGPFVDPVENCIIRAAAIARLEDMIKILRGE